MIQIFMTEDGAIHQKDEIQSGAWIALTNPTATEILEISETCGIDPDHVRAPLDEEERSRIEIEDHYIQPDMILKWLKLLLTNC